jgi:hypothetical protein
MLWKFLSDYEFKNYPDFPRLIFNLSRCDLAVHRLSTWTVFRIYTKPL